MRSFFREATALFLFVFALWAMNSAVAEAATFRIDQAKIRLSVSPGEAKSGEIRVENPSAERLTVKGYLQDWRYLPAADGTKEFSPSSSTDFSCAEWISFAPAEFTLPPFGQQIVRYMVKAPFGVQGGRFAVLFFETQLTQQEAEKEGVGFTVQVRLGALFYVEIENTVKRAAELTGFSVDNDPKNNEYLLITGTLRNIGNTDITCAGSFHIMDRQGMVFARGEFNQVYTFPGDEARLTAGWKEKLPPGIYDIIVTLDLGKALEELGLGRGPVVAREARLEIGEGGQVISAGELR